MNSPFADIVSRVQHHLDSVDAIMADGDVIKELASLRRAVIAGL
jgi:hypothetical protein